MEILELRASQVKGGRTKLGTALQNKSEAEGENSISQNGWELLPVNLKFPKPVIKHHSWEEREC